MQPNMIRQSLAQLVINHLQENDIKILSPIFGDNLTTYINVTIVDQVGLVNSDVLITISDDTIVVGDIVMTASDPDCLEKLVNGLKIEVVSRLQTMV